MKIAIIGNGISGVTAARFLRKKSNHEITIISGETDEFFSRTALMYIYMGHMRFKDTKPYESNFWKKNNIHLKKAWVTDIDFQNLELLFHDNSRMKYDKLILALGSTPNKFGWKGQDLNGVSGLYSYQDLERIEKYSKNLKRAVIVGGGLIGIEMAEMFASRNIPVTFLVREKSFWSNAIPREESDMINRHIKEHHIDLRLGTELKEIVDDGNGNACAVITNTGEKIDCGFVGLTAGVRPNIDFLKETDLEINRGIKVNPFLETNIPNVFAIGDCAENANPEAGRRPVEAIWYTGRMMGETVAYNVLGKRVEYKPRLWFNSAKFFDIEYQVYGTVPAHPEKHQKSIYWEHSDGKKSIRLVYDNNDKTIIGFNLMGVRYRHEICEKWIQEKRSLKYVLENLGVANFDPEFYKQYEKKVVEIYNQKFPHEKIQLKKKRGLAAVLSFLNS